MKLVISRLESRRKGGVYYLDTDTLLPFLMLRGYRTYNSTRSFDFIQKLYRQIKIYHLIIIIRLMSRYSNGSISTSNLIFFLFFFDYNGTCICFSTDPFHFHYIEVFSFSLSRPLNMYQLGRKEEGEEKPEIYRIFLCPFICNF